MKKSILFVSHRGEKCGVHDYGLVVSKYLGLLTSFDLAYVELSGIGALVESIEKHQPDIVLYNYHPDVMRWIHDGPPRNSRAIHVALYHEICQEQAHLYSGLFDYYLAADTTLVGYNPQIIQVPRIVEPFEESIPEPDKLTVGTFGFNTASKDFERVVELTNASFDEAVIRMHIPRHDFLDPDGTELEERKARCRGKITKRGISLEFSHDFKTRDALLRFLAANTVNLFLYKETGCRGISSAIDYALAVDRPFGVSRASMFRNVLYCNPSVCVDDVSIQQLIDNGMSPYRALKRLYHPANSILKWKEALLLCGQKRERFFSVPDGRGFNKLLDDRSRRAYANVIAQIERLAPETVKRKIPRSNVQQAFVFDAVQKFAEQKVCAEVLAIGSFEDTASEALKAKGYRIVEIDPCINTDLRDFFLSPEGVPGRFDIILCCSVLEHVDDDEAFMAQVAELLAPGGVGIFTMDFKEGYQGDHAKPAVDRRLYTTYDLAGRLLAQMPDCHLVDQHSWGDGGNDFEFEGCRYSFASFVFQKFTHPQKLHLDGKVGALATAPWKKFAVKAETLGFQPRASRDAFCENYRRRYFTLDDVIDDFNAEIRERTDRAEAEREALCQQLAQESRVSAELRRTVEDINNSLSMRITAPLRAVKRQFPRTVQACRSAVRVPRQVVRLAARRAANQPLLYLLTRRLLAHWPRLRRRIKEFALATPRRRLEDAGPTLKGHATSDRTTGIAALPSSFPVVSESDLVEMDSRYSLVEGEFNAFLVARIKRLRAEKTEGADVTPREPARPPS